MEASLSLALLSAAAAAAAEVILFPHADITRCFSPQEAAAGAERHASPYTLYTARAGNSCAGRGSDLDCVSQKKTGGRGLPSNCLFHKNVL